MQHAEILVPGCGRTQAYPQGHQTPAQRFGQSQDIGFQTHMLTGEKTAGPPQSGLDFVDDEQHSEFPAYLLGFPQVIGLAHHNSALTLHQLQDESGHLIMMVFQDLAQAGSIIIWDLDEPWGGSPERRLVGRLAGSRQRSKGLTVKTVVSRYDYLSPGG